MNRVHRGGLAAAGVLAALAIAACGNGEQNDYVDQVNEIQTTFLEDLTASASTPPTDAEGAGDLVAEMEGAFTTAADDLEAIDPPEEVADLHAELISSMSTLGEQVSGLGGALESGNPQQVQEAALELQGALTESESEVSSLITDINTQLQE